MYRYGLVATTLALALGCGAPVETRGGQPPGPGPAAPVQAIDDATGVSFFNPGPPPNPPGDDDDDDDDGGGDGPNIRLSEQGLFFGQVCGGSAAERVLNVRNTGDENLRISGLSVSGTGFSLVNRPQLPLTIRPGGQANLRVRFEPDGGQLTPYEGNLRITSNDPDDAVVNVILGGLSLPATVTVSPRRHDFGSVGDGGSRTKRFQLRTSSECPARIGGVRVTGDLSYTIDVGTLPNRVEPGETESFSVEFNCSGEGEDLDALLRILDNRGRSIGSAQLLGRCTG